MQWARANATTDVTPRLARYDGPPGACPVTVDATLERPSSHRNSFLFQPYVTTLSIVGTVLATAVGRGPDNALEFT
jgi:hypothetical protein